MDAQRVIQEFSFMITDQVSWQIQVYVVQLLLCTATEWHETITATLPAMHAANSISNIMWVSADSTMISADTAVRWQCQW